MFLTQLSQRRVGGIASMLMTTADQLLNAVNVFGPPGLMHYVAAMRSHLYRDATCASITETSLVPDLSNEPAPLFRDSNMSVYGIPISSSANPPADSSLPSDDATTSLADLQKRPGFSPSNLEGRPAQEWRRHIINLMFPDLYGRHRRRPIAPAEISSSPRLPRLTVASGPRPTMAYIAVGLKVRGKFDLEKSLALGVRKKQRTALTNGQSVTVTVWEGGETMTRVVRPEDCLGPSKIPTVAIILDIPAPSYIPSLLDSFARSPFYSKIRSEGGEYDVQAVFHLCGKGVVEDARYIEFMNGFSDQTNHIISSPEYERDPVTFNTAAFHQLQVNQLDPDMFTIPHFCLKAKKELTEISGLPAKSFLMEPSLYMGIRPAIPPVVGLAVEKADLFHPATSSPDLLELSPSVLRQFEQIKGRVRDVEGGLRKMSGHDVTVLPLGTSGGVALPFRNVSSTLIRIPGWGSILLDAGEGTWGQLVRQFGPSVWDVLRDLKCIFVSHIHADHHLGVANILTKRRQLDPPPAEPLYLISIHRVHLYLRELSDIEDLGFDDPSGNGVVSVISDALHPNGYATTGFWKIEGAEPWAEFGRSSAAGAKLCRALGLTSLQTVDVRHAVKAYGLVVKHRDGWSIVYSGDTVPAGSLVRAGKYATLLIHEATLGDDELALCQLKQHSTVGQAIDVGKNMKAANILLTHFSGRYANRRKPVVAFAFDHANLTIGTMWKMSFYLPVIKQVIQESYSGPDGSVNTLPDRSWFDLPYSMDPTRGNLYL
ncbi:hypothetical protein B0H10DRAFT_2130608 [Mycena sp. CBHHK59/15]|nr:hypothetical protein B0H10DRAFT_2130608 [Mycena sp. CBHHK59/15]